MDLSIVTISTNEAEFLKVGYAELPRVLGSLAVEVFLIDNCCTDGSAEIARSLVPEVRVIRNERRLGFSANNNLAIRASRGRHILILNPDTVVRPGALETMVRYLDTHPDVGICGPKLLFPDGQLQLSCRRFPSWRSALARRTPLRRFLWNSSLNARHLMADVDHDRVQQVDWMLGACLMARRAAIDQVGPLDEGFFLYVEDIDWCYRMWQSGWKVVYLPEATVVHHHRAETDHRWLTRRTWIHYKGIARFVWKHYLHQSRQPSSPA
jgi:GT2 family glycosyltransferase